MNDQESIRLLARYRDGDEVAAQEIFDRYTNRLVALAGSRLSEAMRRRVESDDIVQSAYRSFFRNAAADRYTIEHAGQLWGLLAAITINKVRSHAKHHRAQKRDIGAEASAAASQSCYGLSPAQITHEPTADEAAALVEQLNQFSESLSPIQRDVLELYLQNQSNDAIATVIRRSARTVRRLIDEVKSRLEEELQT